MSLMLYQRNKLNFQRKKRTPVLTKNADAKLFKTLAFLVIHIPLGLLVYKSSVLAYLHGLTVLSVGLYYALSRKTTQVAYVGAYIAGAEVLWRMSESSIVWEFGKYATSLIFIICIINSRNSRSPKLLVLYLLCLLPSVPLALGIGNLSVARQMVSFNMSGPISLVICSWFFSGIRLKKQNLSNLLIALLAPVIGVAFVTLFGTITTSDITFNTESNHATSGGFGPNQVSSILGLGAFIAFLFWMLNKEALKSKILMFGIMVVASIQSAMTFSRGGLYGAAGAAIVATLFLAKSPREVSRIILLGLLLLVLGKFIIVPSLDKFTHGALSERFEETDLTGRGDLAGADIRIWLDNPILGVGPGMAEGYRNVILTTGGAAHTEFTRLISEHGFFGITALLLLIFAGVRTTLGAKPPLAKAIRASLIVWSCLYMSNAAMRLVAPSFIWGLAFATYIQGNRPSLKRLRFILASKMKVIGHPVNVSATQAAE